jgi:hypothetical protein
MDKTRLQADIGLIAGMSAYMCEHMKLDPDKIVSDEEMRVVDMCGELAFALRNLDSAIDALPD